MPLVSSIIWVAIHVMISLGLNWVMKELGLINHSEFMSLYFIVLATLQFDSKLKFTKAFKQDPELIYHTMLDQLERE